MTITFLFVALFVLMFIGIPVAISLGLSGAMTILFFSNDSVRSLAIKLFETSEHYTLLAIPFFLLSGAFMTSGGVARRLIDFANACVGHIKGGLAIAAILACMLFAALSGSSPATVAAVGSIVIAGMVRSGYKQDFAAGIVCNAGTLGILIPPSIVMVVYATATETSVGKLFMAGVVPGAVAGPCIDDHHLHHGPRERHAIAATGLAQGNHGRGPKGRLGPDADRDHSGRYLLGHVHTD